MIKSKHLLYAFKTKVNKNYHYWYETDNKYFCDKKPPQKVLDEVTLVKDHIDQKDIIDNPWNEWESHNIQKIISDEGVCINYLKTTKHEKIHKDEDIKLLELYHHIVENFDINSSFDFDTLKKWHKEIFGRVYPFAGELRSVEMSKGDSKNDAWTWRMEFLNGIPQFDKMVQEISSNSYDDIDKITYDLARLNAEFLFIHPFREGNGRMSRLFTDIILAKNGFPMIGLKLQEGDHYIQRVHAGYDCDYEPLQQLLKMKIKDEMEDIL